MVHSATLDDVYSLLSTCREGPVDIIISRHPDPEVRRWLRTQQLPQRRRSRKMMSCCVLQVSEQQLRTAIAQAVDASQLRRGRSHWSMDGNSS